MFDIEEEFEGFKIEKNDDTYTEEHNEDKENEDTQEYREDCLTSPVDVKHEYHEDEGQEPQHDVTAQPTQQIKRIVNLACQWSTQKPIVSKCVTTAASKGAISKGMPPPPQAYLVKDIYQRKREEAERRRAEEERKKREFHSRPVPNFKAYHEQMDKRKQPHAFTVAVTPQVLKKSKEADEKRRKRVSLHCY